MFKSFQHKLWVLPTHKVTDLLMHLGLAFMVVAISLVLFVFVLLPTITSHGQVITVPDLAGMPLDEAERFLRSRGMDYIVGDTSYSRKHKLNAVLSQSPKAGEKVKNGRRIVLNVNPKTAPKVKVPNLDGQQLADARRTLENEGLEVGRVTYKPDIGKDVVLEYYVNGRRLDSALVAKGYQVHMGTKIDLLVADGRGETEFNVPNLIGLSEEEAEEVANAHEINLQKIYDYKSKRPLGTVIWQNPPTHVGKARQGIKTGTYADTRERNKIRAGDVIDIRVAGNPSAKPMDEKEMAEYDKIRDSVERDIRIRKGEEMKKHYERWKPEVDKSKKEQKVETDKKDPEKKSNPKQ